jgi:hypothetical protein
VLKTSFEGGGRNFPEPLMRFVRDDLRDLVESQKNDHSLSYRRYGASQRGSRPKIKIREIFGVVRFSTFSTVSARSRRSRNFGQNLRPHPKRSKPFCQRLTHCEQL